VKEKTLSLNTRQHTLYIQQKQLAGQDLVEALFLHVCGDVCFTCCMLFLDRPQ
jgi:hypothetical protein